MITIICKSTDHPIQLNLVMKIACICLLTAKALATYLLFKHQIQKAN